MERGVVWSTLDTPTVDTNEGKAVHTVSSTGTFESSITGLELGKTYNVRAYAQNIVGIAYGGQETFTTPDKPSVTATAVPSAVTTTTAASGGTVANNGGASITARGVVWSTATIPDLPDDPTMYSRTTDNTGSGTYTSSITGLDPGTTYFVRAYATNNAGTGFAPEQPFKTDAFMPAVTTSDVTEVTTTTAKTGGTITNDGGATVTAKGVCWNTAGTPTVTVNDGMMDKGAGLEAEVFTSDIVGLTHNTLYYVRAYATNEKGTAYGAEKSFSTPAAAYPMVQSIEPVTFAGPPTAAVVSATAISKDVTPIDQRGFCWNTSGTPMVGENCAAAGSGTGVFSYSITGLKADTTYYVRPYVVNTRATAYGAQLAFRLPGAPVVTTAAVTEVDKTTAVTGGKVTTDPSTNVTERGVCWNIASIPGTGDPKAFSYMASGSGTGTFTSSITGLTEGTAYYVRAYAVTDMGTYLGQDEKSFTTATAPKVTTADAKNITTSSVTAGGNVTSASTGTVSERGVCWSMTEAMPAKDNSSICGAASSAVTGAAFTVDITALTPGQTYNVRAYAINEFDTGYAENAATFKTRCLEGDVDGNGMVELNDAIVALKVLSGVDPGVAVCLTADVNGDNKIGIEEVIFILRKVLGV
jgi:hypothetical protein